MTTAAATASAEAEEASTRRPWTLQTRLMVTVIGIVALILLIVAVTVSAILGGVLQQNLDARITAATRSLQVLDVQPGYPPTVRTAYETLSNGRQYPGFLLVLNDGSAVTGAVVGENGIASSLTPAQIAQLQQSISHGDPNVTLDGLGQYRIATVHSTLSAAFTGIAGLPMTEVNATIATMLLTIGVVTTTGLLLLAFAIVIVIRLGLKPLRAVAETATRVAALPMDQGSVSIAERVPAAEADERTEIGRVGAALNTLLDHVDSSLDARQHNEERMRRFVADASHELRTPLASIRGYSELSLRALRQAQGAREAAQGAREAAQGAREAAQGAREAADSTESALERIQAQSVRMTTLVEDLLLLARLDEGQELVYGTVDLTRLCIDAVGDAQAAGRDHAWQLDVGEEPVVVAGDAGRLHQVVANLLANARTHTPAGTTVRVSLGRDGSEAVLRVHDDGPGVDPEIADELFERFSRADRSRARKTGGTGLGLSIVKAIVEAHHGTVVVESEPGDTSFIVRLPAQPPAPVDHTAAPEIDAADVEAADAP